MKTMSNKFRIKIDLSNVAMNPSRVWLLVNPDDCKNIETLKRKIVDKFSLLYSDKRFDVVLQDFIMPDDESIEIIKPDDAISLRLKPLRLKRRSLVDIENDGQTNEVALAVDENQSEKRKRKKSSKRKSVEKISKFVDTEVNTKKRKRKNKEVSRDEEQISYEFEVTDNILRAYENTENDKEEKSENKKSQVIDEDYEAMFPLPKKRRRKHRKKTPVTAYEYDDTMQNVVEKPLGSFSLKSRDYDDTEHVRRHLKFADEDDVEENGNSINIEDTENPNYQCNIIKETSTIEKTLPKQVVENQTLDLSKFERLIGPPRPKDHICYQVLELSEDYSPQLSSVRVGKVKSYDPNLNIVTVEFDTPMETRPRKGKFELIDKVEGDEDYFEEEIEKEEEIILIANESYNLAEMIDLKVHIEKPVESVQDEI